MGHKAYWTRHILKSTQIDSQPVDLTLSCCSNTKQTKLRCIQSFSLQFIENLNGFPLLFTLKASNMLMQALEQPPVFKAMFHTFSPHRDISRFKYNAEANQICIFTPSFTDAEQAVRHWAGIERLKPEERGLFIESIQIRHSLVLSLDFSSTFSSACFCDAIDCLDSL